MFIDDTSSENRMRDLAKIMLAHYDFMKTTKKAGAFTLYLCGGFNFETKLNI
jgi:hypothetical protein